MSDFTQAITGGRDAPFRDPFTRAGQFQEADADIFGAALGYSFEQTPFQQALDKQDILISQGKGVRPGSRKEGIAPEPLPGEPAMSREAWQESDYAREDVQWHEGMTPTQARILARRSDTRNRLEALKAYSKGSLSAELTAMATAEFSDPINLATAFVPVPGLGEARLAMLGERIGALGTRVVRGAAEGAFGSALVEPFLAQGADLLQEDYTFMQSLQNVAMGAFVGSALHSGVGLVRGEFRRVPVESHVEAFDTALAQAQLGREIDVRGVIRTEPMEWQGPRRPLSEAPEARDFDLGAFRGAAAGGRYADYTPVAPAERRWLEAVNAELQSTEAGYRIFHDDGRVEGVKATTPEWFQLYNRTVAEQQVEAKKIRKANETLPDAQKKPVQPVGSILTRADVNRVTRKLLNHEPLGKREGEIAAAVMEEARAMRQENARQMVEARENRPDPDIEARQRITSADADFEAGRPDTVAAFDDVASFFDEVAATAKPVRELSDLEKEVQGMEETIAEARKLEHLDESDEAELQRIAELEKEAATYVDALKAAETCMRMG